MAKRRRKKPNISQAVLEQALQGTVDQGDEDESSAQSTPAAAPTTTAAQPRARRRRGDLQATQLERRKGEGNLDGEYVAELLANPTKVVSEEDLRADYGFVIKDLRNMGMLAAVLFVALVAAALVLL